MRRLKIGTDRTYIPDAPPASECFTAVVANIDGFAIHTHTNESMTVRDRFTTYDLCAVNSTQMPPEKTTCRHVGKKVLVAFYVMFTKRIISRNHLWWERVTYLSASFLSGTHAVARAW